jgi:hypothetical protein
MDQTSRFTPKRGLGPKAQLAHIEDFLSRLAIPAAPIVSAGGGGAIVTSAPTDRIPESQVIFDATLGHAHEGSDSHLITILGDVTGTNAVSLVVQIQGHSVPAPGAPEDGKVLQWNNGGAAYQWAAASSLSKSILSGWTRADISLTGTVDTRMNRVNALATAGAAISLELPYAATVYAISLSLSGDGGGAATQYDVTLYKNGVATAMAASLPFSAAPGQTFASHTDATGISFTTTDTLDIYDKRTGALSAVACEVLLVLQLA